VVIVGVQPGAVSPLRPSARPGTGPGVADAAARDVTVRGRPAL